MKIPDEIIKSLNAGYRYIITAHRNPDPDAVGSAIMLGHLLKRIGMEAEVVFMDPPPQNVGFFEGYHDIKVKKTLSMGPNDCLCVVDSGSFERIGFFKDGGKPEKIINIDHHFSNENYGSVNWVDPDASSCSILIYELFKKLDIQPSVEIAAITYATLLTETGCFQYSNTSARALAVAAELVGLGVNPGKVSEKIYNCYQLGRIKLTGLVLSRIMLDDNGCVGWLNVKLDDYEATETSSEDTDGLVNYALSVESVKVGVLLKEIEKDAAFKISLRSKGAINVSDVAAAFGGGGHKQAAGCLLRGTLEEVVDKLRDRLTEFI